MPLEVAMKSLTKLGVVIIALLWLVGCASQEPAPEPEPEPTPEVEPAIVEEETAPGPLEVQGIAGFVTSDNQAFADGDLVTLYTGGSVRGRLSPASTNPDVVLYVTRDGSVPSAENNWGGAIDPERPPVITRALEGTAVYRVVAELNEEYSDPFTLNVVWQHEEDPEVALPEFLVDGNPVTGSVELPVSDGSDAAGRLEISCEYLAATLYITRDGSDPSPDNYWKTQLCEGTYIYSPEPTAAQYRVIAIWQGAQSDVASLDVEWVSE
jgi:hypothetical protein